VAHRPDFNRSDRIRKAMIREFSDILMRDIKEPKLMEVMISVTDAEVSGDLRHVRIFVSIRGDATLQDEIMDILIEQTPKIRSELGHRISLRHTPEIDIRLDTSLERGARVTHLLNKITRGEELE
jgi:ribosome-binding factor A